MYNEYVGLILKLRTTEIEVKKLERDLLELYLSHHNTLKQEDYKAFLDEISKLEEKEEDLRNKYFKINESVHECRDKLN